MELFQDTIIKLVVRQGSDSDRKQILLDSGEPGYTTDTKRLFIGDGVLSGGVVAGNKYLGKASDITTLAPGLPGDFAYSKDLGNLYAVLPNVGDGSVITDWDQIGGGFYTGSKYITISSNNVISLNLLSAYSLDQDLVNSTAFFTLCSGRLTVSLSSVAPIYFDGNTIKLAPLSAYSISDNALDPNTALIINLSGQLQLPTQLPLYSSNNTLKLSALSAFSLSTDVIGLSAPIVIDNTGRLEIQVQSPIIIDTNTLKISLTALYNLIYPVGSVYYSVSGVDPSTLFIGTVWTQISQGRFIVGVGTDTDNNSTTKTFLSGQNTGLYIDNNVPDHHHYIASTATGRNGVPPSLSSDNVMCTGGGGPMGFGNDYQLDGRFREATIGLTSGVLSSIYVPSLSANITSTATSLSSITNCPPSFGMFVWQRIA